MVRLLRLVRKAATGSLISAQAETARASKQTEMSRPLRYQALRKASLQGGYPVAVTGGTAGDTSDINEGDGVVSKPTDFTPFQPQYCVAVGGDTAPLVEVGLTYEQDEGENPYSGSLEFERIDVSGYKYDELPAGCFPERRPLP
jgi:hypothetical protein